MHETIKERNRKSVVNGQSPLPRATIVPSSCCAAPRLDPVQQCPARHEAADVGPPGNAAARKGREKLGRPYPLPGHLGASACIELK